MQTPVFNKKSGRKVRFKILQNKNPPVPWYEKVLTRVSQVGALKRNVVLSVKQTLTISANSPLPFIHCGLRISHTTHTADFTIHIIHPLREICNKKIFTSGKFKQTKLIATMLLKPRCFYLIFKCKSRKIKKKPKEDYYARNKRRRARNFHSLFRV